jgi:hypothetical protein
MDRGGAAARVVVILGLAGCAGSAAVPVALTPTHEIKASEYEEVLRRWTRGDEVYDGLESKLFVHATFHSPEFRRAFALRHTDVYGPGSEEASRLLLTSPEAEEQLEFFFSASTSSPGWNDFDRPDSIWRVTLEGDDHERVDGKVLRLRASANLRVIYPFITDYAKTYTVRFPRTTPGGRPVISNMSHKFVLRFSSALGTANLIWNLIPSSVPDEGVREQQPLPKKPE